MNWYHHPELVDQLASAYVLGTLQGPARRRFEGLMLSQPAMARAVDDWTWRLGPLMTTMPPVEPSAALWAQIAQRAGIAAPPTPQPIATTAPWWRRWLAPLPAGALAMGLVVGTVAPLLWQAQTASTQDTQLPASYVGVLATAQGTPGLIVSSLRLGKIVEIKHIAPVDVPAGQTLYLWRIDKAGVVSPVAAFPAGKFTRVALPEAAEKVFFTAVELAVSIEVAGTAPTVPTQAFVYRGLCGKLWR